MGLKRLERQNPGLRVGRWVILGSKSSDKGLHVSLRIDKESEVALDGSEWRPYYRTQRASFVTLDKEKKKPATEEGTSGEPQASTSKEVGGMIRNWHVSDEPSLSDHAYIRFEISNCVTEPKAYRDPRRTNWESYRDDLQAAVIRNWHVSDEPSLSDHAYIRFEISNLCDGAESV
ncbi:protein of unknown function (DUF4780) [Popillia japonica]|uniref:DUF4780 domain-containing protein n=1 Tax=Popillia japonica TaxID=7064 RepID=A0AAW1N0W9_POPJA